MVSQRAVQATFKSGTLKSFSKLQVTNKGYMNQKTYKHSVNGSKSSAWHVTRVNMDIKKENLIFEILSNTALFYKSAICDFPTDLFDTPSTHADFPT